MIKLIYIQLAKTRCTSVIWLMSGRSRNKKHNSICQNLNQKYKSIQKSF